MTVTNGAPRKITRSVKLTREQDDYLQALARASGHSYSELIRIAIEKLRRDPVIFLPAAPRERQSDSVSEVEV